MPIDQLQKSINLKIVISNMPNLNQGIKKIQSEITELKDYSKVLKIKDPEAYQNEAEAITEKMKDLHVRHLESVIESYKKQNPDKYKAKEPILNAKLEYLKQGGDPKVWNYSVWNQTQKPPMNSEVKSEVPVPVESLLEVPEAPAELECKECEFTAKSKAGLAVHSKKHK